VRDISNAKRFVEMVTKSTSLYLCNEKVQREYGKGFITLGPRNIREAIASYTDHVANDGHLGGEKWGFAGIVSGIEMMPKKEEHRCTGKINVEGHFPALEEIVTSSSSGSLKVSL